MAALHDRIVRLQVKLANGRLYAIRGDFEPKLAYEIDLLGQSAAAPHRRIGMTTTDPP